MIARNSFAILLLAVLASAAPPVNPPTHDSLPSAADIWKKYIAAIGGENALKKVNTRVMKGTYSIPTKGYTRPVVVYAKAPGKYAFYTVGKSSSAARGVDGTTGWSRNFTEEGVRLLQGAELEAEKREAVFLRDLHFADLYPTMKVLGVETVSDHEVFAIEAVGADGLTEKMYFDKASGLLLQRNCPMYRGFRNVEVQYDNYKDVDGVKLPHTIRIVRSVAPFMSIFAFDEIKQNVTVDDAQFSVPEAPRN